MKNTQPEISPTLSPTPSLAVDPNTAALIYGLTAGLAGESLGILLNELGPTGQMVKYQFIAPGYAITAYANFYKLDQDGKIVYQGAVEGVEGTIVDISLAYVASETVALISQVLWNTPTVPTKIAGAIGGTVWLALNPDIANDVKTIIINGVNAAIEATEEFTETVAISILDVYSNNKLSLQNTDAKTTITYTPDPSSALLPTTQDIIDAIIPIKQSPIAGNPFFDHPEVNITLPSGRSRAYIGTDASEAFNLIPGSQVPGGGTLVYTLGGDDEIGVNGGNNWIDGGNGTDTVSYSSATPDTQGVPLSVIVGSSGSKNATAIVERTINPEQNTDTLVNIEKINGGEGEDTLSFYSSRPLDRMSIRPAA